MNNISDYTSHAIQDEIDDIISMLGDDNDDICNMLANIRDSIPCSCGTDDEE